jgi:hypothetical protein
MPGTRNRPLRPSPERFAAAGALQDPNLLLQLQAARARGERPDALDEAKVGILATALVTPAPTSPCPTR